MLLAFAVAGLLIIKTINIYLYQHMEKDSAERAKIHMAELTSSIMAQKDLERLIDDKLEVACKIVVDNQDKISTAYVEQIGKDLKVNDVNWFSKDGKILYSNVGGQGWQAKEGHPIERFIHSDRQSMIESIRKDFDTERYHKYAYLKAANGEFVQIGIYANEIHNITDKFSPQNYITKLTQKYKIEKAIFVDNAGNLFTSEKGDSYELSAEEHTAIDQDQNYFTKNKIDGKKLYETLMPVHVMGKKEGTLILFYSFEGVDELFTRISLIVFVLLVYIFAVYSMMKTTLTKRTKEIEKLIYADLATNLPNKNRFVDWLEGRITDIQTKRALILLNFENINLVRLISGQEAVNALMGKKAGILKNLFPGENQVFRYSEDTFCILVEPCIDIHQLSTLCEEVIENLEGINALEESGKLIVKRAGILELKPEYQDLRDIAEYIEITINKIQKLEDKSYWFFNKAIRKELIQDEIIEKELRKAIYDGLDKEFYLQYQPQIHVKKGKIIGLEALARWNSPELGLVPPEKFIQIAEHSHLIIPLGDWILQTAFSYIKKIEDLGYQDFKVAINISGIQVYEERFIEKLNLCIQEAGIQPEHIELEITETNFMNNFDLVNKKLEAIQQMGVSISLDDFGTGYSTLSRLRDLHIDTLKIDKSFVDNLSQEDDLFVRSIILLAQQLDVSIVAEGVETVAQMRALKDLGCCIIQGYLFSKPIHEDKALEFLEHNI